MVIGTSMGLSDGATVALAVALAFFLGYALTMRGLLRAGLPFRAALKVALAADTVSIAVMEFIDNVLGARCSVPGARCPVPCKGHAVVHPYHCPGAGVPAADLEAMLRS